MKRLACIAVVSACLIAATLPAAGADAGAGAFIFGNGNDSCGAWTQGRSEAGKSSEYPITRSGMARMGRESWVLGLLSQVNLSLPTDRGAIRDLAEGTDNAGLMAYIDNYCAALPIDTLLDAIMVLSNELLAKWHAAHPPR